VHSPKDAVLYLWKVHNRVNIRLQGRNKKDVAVKLCIKGLRRFLIRRTVGLSTGTGNLFLFVLS
jgi:hypothetical protein